MSTMTMLAALACGLLAAVLLELHYIEVTLMEIKWALRDGQHKSFRSFRPAIQVLAHRPHQAAPFAPHEPPKEGA